MIKFMLNIHKFNNYAFFCPVSRLHLTVSSPVGFASEVTPAISKALKAKTILDVDGVVDIETGTVKEAKQATAKSAKPVQAPEQKIQEPKKDAEPKKVEETVEKTEEKPAEDKSKKGVKKAAAKTDAE